MGMLYLGLLTISSLSKHCQIDLSSYGQEFSSSIIFTIIFFVCVYLYYFKLLCSLSNKKLVREELLIITLN